MNRDKTISWGLLGRAALVCGLVSIQACGNGDNLDTADHITGVVSAPNGKIALGGARLMNRLARFWSGPAWALTGVEPVADAEVQLAFIDSSGNVSEVLATDRTDSSAGYDFALASNEKPGSSLTVRVGSGDTLIRAFVYASDVPLDSASEATVRLVLASGYRLANFSASEIDGIQSLVDGVTASVPAGSSIAVANDRAELVAADDEAVVLAIDAAGASS